MNWYDRAMSRMSLPLAALLLIAGLPAQFVRAAEIDELLDREMPSIVDLYRTLHAAPELSYFEEKTSAQIAAELRKLGFDVTERIGTYPNPELQGYGVAGVLKNGDGPVVLVRTDLDALPIEETTGRPFASRVRATNEAGESVPVMHACAHDAHMSAFVATARLLAALKNEWSGTLVMIGQPAEERGAGAKAMLADGLYQRFPRPDYALALHTSASLPAGTIGWVEGFAFASVDSVDVTIRGVGGHGAYPHTTKDPIVLASETVLAVQTIVSREVSPLEPAVVTVGSFQAGTKHNIIPDEARLQLTVRAYAPEVREQILSSLERIARGIAIAGGVPEDRLPIVSVMEEESIPSTYNDPELTRRLLPAWRNALGAENVRAEKPVMGGEDFGLYALENHEIPTVLFWLGGVQPDRARAAERGEIRLPSLHSPLFAPDAETAIRTGARAMVASVLELMPRADD